MATMDNTEDSDVNVKPEASEQDGAEDSGKKCATRRKEEEMGQGEEVTAVTAIVATANDNEK